jgi:hypothetical protein
MSSGIISEERKFMTAASMRGRCLLKTSSTGNPEFLMEMMSESSDYHSFSYAVPHGPISLSLVAGMQARMLRQSESLAKL